MDIRTLHVVSLDVWGNEIDGYEVNSAYYTGIDITCDIESDQDIITSLQVGEGFLSDKANIDTITIDGDPDFMITVDDTETGYPLYQLHANR